MDGQATDQQADTTGRVVLFAPPNTSRCSACWPRVSVWIPTPVLGCCRVPSANGVKDGRNALATSLDSWNGKFDQCSGASDLEIGMVGPRRRRSTTVGGSGES